MDDENLVSFSGKKKRVISSSSSDEDRHIPRHKTPKCHRSNLQANDSRRSSERIRKRQSRTFSLPSREEVWKDIPTEKNVEKEIRKLTPKKLVNNFTKENHRYNYDPVYTSGEESLEEFINDSETSESASESKSGKGKRKRKVKYYHPRIVKESSSDTDSEQGRTRNNNNDSSDTDSDIGLKLRRNSAKKKSKCIESESEDENNRKSTEISNARKRLDSDSDKADEDKGDSEDDVIAAVDRHRGCIIDSDDETGETDTQSKSKVKVVTDSEPKVKVETETQPKMNVENDADFITKVKVETDEQYKVELTMAISQDNIDKEIKTEIKLENASSEELDSCEKNNMNNDSVNDTSVKENGECKSGTSRHDSGIVADSEICEICDSDASTSSSEVELIDIGVPGDEIEPKVLFEICRSDFDWSDTEDDSYSEEEDSEISDSDVEVKSERTRVLMVKKKRKKEKLFEMFREARELKLQRESKRRQSEIKKETVDNGSSNNSYEQ